MKETIRLSCIDLIDLLGITGGCCDSCHDDDESFEDVIETPDSRYSFDLSHCCAIAHALDDMGLYRSSVVRYPSHQYNADRYRRFKRLWLKHRKAHQPLSAPQVSIPPC